ncbi:DUF6691 family protein [Methylomonas rosea]|uniref:YeeE/YedE family protein n=1 Tax=Methylomonas rosea TaxID=2952227 RepID=A0ABT1TV27_9GAMM|nr:DUF6691 family protein [Methylomonas sp. WSC-7]MCQ8118611.1 YeeE/YedE family protein [Methylomonas sp. WSC-7]
MKNTVYLFAYGLLFGLGLIVAGMSNPAKVLAFLDVAGAWDPSLALVMASALLTLGLARYFMHRNNDAADSEQEPSARVPAGVDGKLITGAAIFGVGWGLSGFCPGPALLGLSAGVLGNYAFVTAMFAGFWLFRLLHQR